jgi:membrane-bound serine protease (ClpP class)
VLGILAAVLLTLFVLPQPWGFALIGVAIAWELAEKAFLFRLTRRIPHAVGQEALIGTQAEVLAPCRPRGKVRLRGERWDALCSEGADVDEAVIVEAVDHLTLVVSRMPLRSVAARPSRDGAIWKRWQERSARNAI